MARRANAGVAASLLVCALFACSTRNGSGDEHDDNNFRADVIECEDALDRLERCCPGFDATPVLCNYFHQKATGCGTASEDDVRPALSRDESACIRDTSCDALVAKKVCERAQLARTYQAHEKTPLSTSDTPTTTTTTHDAVCP